MRLRDYQRDAVDAVFGYFERGGSGNPLIVIPTGGGKSLCLAELARRVVRDHDSRVMVLAHRRELLQQNADKLARIDSDLDIGVYSAGLNSKDTDSDVLFAGIQSVYDRAKSISNPSRPIELLFVDEAHLIPFDGGMYRRLISDLKGINPHLRIVGCTATPWRYRKATATMSGGYDLLTEGDGAVFDEIVYDMQARIPEMIDAGYLSPLWPAAVGYGVNLSGVRLRNGDFEEAELNRIMSSDEVVKAILEDAIPRALADQRHHWLVFCSGVQSGQAMLDGLLAWGIDAEMVTGSTPAGERDRIVQAFVGGRLRCLVSVNVLGVGFDAPNADLIIMARPTVSPIIHCLDEKTEILTSHGWKGIGEIKVGDCVPSMDTKTWKGKWANVISTIERETMDGEMFCSFESPRANFRVTENHNMIISTQCQNKTHTQFKMITAAEMAKKGGLVFMPTAVHMDTPGVPLTQWELYLIGMVLTNGSVSNQAIYLYQSERHPEIISRIDECLENCGLAYVKRRVCTKESTIKEVNKRWSWTISISRANRIRSKTKSKHDAVIKEGIGASYLLPYLDKNIAGALLNCTKEQFDMLFKGIFDGDGFKTSKCPSVNWNPKTMTIISARKEAVEKMQIMACLHGYTAHLRTEHKEREKPIWFLSLTPQDWMSIQIGGKTTKRPRLTIKTAEQKEKVWCIETSTGTIITRRSGKITVMGNCQYLGRGCRPTQAKMTLDESGRARGCLVLDYVGNVERHGPINTIRVKAPAPKKPPPMRDCPRCEESIPIQAKVCPHCGADIQAAKKEKKDKPLPALTGADIIAGLGHVAKATQTGSVPVTEARYSAHLGQSGIITLRADYYNGMLRVVSEWVCFNHDPGSFPRRKAVEWFAKHVGESYTPPKTVEEFMLWKSMGMPVKRPVSVTVRKRKGEKYLELVRVRLEETKCCPA